MSYSPNFRFIAHNNSSIRVSFVVETTPFSNLFATIFTADCIIKNIKFTDLGESTSDGIERYRHAIISSA